MEFRLDDALPVLQRTPAVLHALLLDLPGRWTAGNEGLGTWRPFDVVRQLMIRSFRDRDSEALFNDVAVRRLQAVERQARRKLLYLNRARTLGDLNAPPGNRLEALKGERRGQYSIRINDQWRICFTWRDGDAHDVEIVDDH